MQPYSLRGSIAFGNKNETSESSFVNPTEISFEMFADILKSANGASEMVSDSRDCSQDILKFSPPPQNKVCDQSIYKHLTTLHDYGVNITFHNVSFPFQIEFHKTLNCSLELNVFIFFPFRTRNYLKMRLHV